MDIIKLLKTAHQRSASFVYLNLDSPPALRINDKIINLQTANITTDDMDVAINKIMDETQKKIYEDKGILHMTKDIEKSFKIETVFFKDRLGVAILCKIIPNDIILVENIPPFMWDIKPDSHSGLVIITGLKGSGKSNIVANIINNFNKQSHYHILTIEDEVIFKYESAQSIINQLKVDNESFQDTMNIALYGNYDIVTIDSIYAAANFDLILDITRKCNNLVFLVIDARSASAAIAYLVNALPNNYELNCLSVSEAIEAVLLQTLLIGQESNKIVNAFELIIANNTIRKLIISGELQKVCYTSQSVSNTCSMKDSLHSLVNNKVISNNDAESVINMLTRADNRQQNIAKIQEECDNNGDEAAF